MCNLFSMSKGQQAIRELPGAVRDTAGNLPMLPGIFPDYAAPIVCTGAGGMRELAMARWGMPSPTFALQRRQVDRGVTNVRNTASSHWRCRLAPAARCLVPFTSFSEPGLNAEDKLKPVWFALDDSCGSACKRGSDSLSVQI
jgi:putative SOS response-associated peptidase YedK